MFILIKLNAPPVPSLDAMLCGEREEIKFEKMSGQMP